MKLDIHEHHVEVSDALRARVEQRLRCTLERFGPRVLQAAVDLADPGGPRGGCGKHCRIVVAAAGAEQVVVDVLDVDLAVAIDRAVDRLAGATARELGRAPAPLLRIPVATRLPAAAVFRRVERSPELKG